MAAALTYRDLADELLKRLNILRTLMLVEGQEPLIYRNIKGLTWRDAYAMEIERALLDLLLQLTPALITSGISKLEISEDYPYFIRYTLHAHPHYFEFWRARKPSSSEVEIRVRLLSKLPEELVRQLKTSTDVYSRSFEVYLCPGYEKIRVEPADLWFRLYRPKISLPLARKILFDWLYSDQRYRVLEELYSRLLREVQKILPHLKIELL